MNEKLKVSKQMNNFKIFLEWLLYPQKERSLLQKNINLFNWKYLHVDMKTLIISNFW